MHVSVYTIGILSGLVALVVPYVGFAAPLYTVSPLVIDESLEPRDIEKREITITNTGDQPVTLYPSVNNIAIEENGTIEEFLPPVLSDRARSLAAWIEVSRAGIDLAPGETHTLPVTLRISHDAVPGKYHAYIGFGNGRNRDEAEAQVKNGHAPGVVVNVTVEDTTFSFLKLAAFVVDRFVTSQDNQAAVYTFKNPSDEALVPKGEIIIYDQSGKEVGMIPVNSEQVSVGPGEEHVFTAQVPTSGLFGKYKAFLSVEYGTEQVAAIQDTSFFYIIPLKVVIALAIVLLLFVGYGAWHMHRTYLDEEDDAEGADQLSVHVRDTTSDPKHHDLHLPRV